MNKYLKAERELALLLGWTALQDANGALVGTPPQGYPECRGQAMVPSWARDNGAAFGLMVNHGIEVRNDFDGYWVMGNGFSYSESFSDHESKEHCLRYAIVQAVIEKLKD